MRLYGLLALALAMGCSGKDKAEDDTNGAEGGGEGGEGGGGDDGVSPVVSAIDAWCWEHTVGDPGNFWEVRTTVDDPQGNDTLESFQPEGLRVLQGSTEDSVQAMVCTDAGACTTSFGEDATGISCSGATGYTFEVSIVDEDGNTSEPASVEGRQGSSSEG